ncbi:MAG TPA: retropepsin-like aspartic protease [Parafilimonas sp.]|nr:retropepsin-like aspartic protease [Parafilimonas sp.]
MKTILVFLLTLRCTITSAQTVIPLEITDGGYIFLRMLVNGNDTARFMLDTGSGITVVSQNLFARYHLQEAGLHTGTRHNGESITGMLYILPSLSAGTFTRQNVVIGVYDALPGCDGLLSMNYFRDTPFTIDFKHKSLIIETTSSIARISKNATRVPIKLKLNGKDQLDFFVHVCINDSIPADAEFDTGSGFNMLMLHTKYLEPLHIDLAGIPKQNYGYYVYSTTLPSLSYCDALALRQQNVFVGFKEGLIYEALIGSGMFRDRLLTIDIPNSEMLVH